MMSIAAVHVIRSWALERMGEGVALREDTPRFNLLVQAIDRMAARVDRGGPEMEADVYEILVRCLDDDIPTHETPVANLKAAFADLMAALRAAGAGAE